MIPPRVQLIKISKKKFTSSENGSDPKTLPREKRIGSTGRFKTEKKKAGITTLGASPPALEMGSRTNPAKSAFITPSPNPIRTPFCHHFNLRLVLLIIFTFLGI